LDWVLQHFDREAAWFDLCGFDRKQHEARVAVTHTIAYTIFGVLHMSQALQREDGVEAARLAALGALRRTELRSGVPGLMSVGWRAAAEFVCLTGNAQLALIWFRLFDIDGDLRYVNAALKALDQVKRAQPVHVEHPGLRGGIPGSAPVWGDCISYAVPNWAAKFFIDALLTKDEVMRKVATSRMNSRAPVPDRTVTADGGAAFAEREIKIIGFTQSGAEKPAKLLAETARWGFSPEAMIIETGKPAPLAARIRDRARRDGIAAIVSAVRKRLTAAPVNGASAGSEGAGADMDPEELCHQRGIPVYTVESVNTPEALQLIARLEPDIAVLLGAGILKKSVLAIPNMATLNAHMGLLPFYRGMNVTEWAALNGDPVGCTVHQVDSGIDTGPILATRTVSHDGAGSIAELRDRVDREQIRLLAEVLEFIVTRRAMPAAKVQAREDGLQFYRMHDELKRVLEHDLQAAAVSRGARPAG
jgi:folate-dependent phosphoribosylglycinamide formyltransferase PurN